VFFWGIGNSVAPAITELLRRCEQPEVLFSPIRGRPRPVDAAPASVVAWTAAETLTGELFSLPPTVLVTSRADNGSVPAHYALVCALDAPLVIADLGNLNFRGLRNLLSGRSVGASQVTAIVSNIRQSPEFGPDYPIALRAWLVEPYFVRLRQPVRCEVAGGQSGVAGRQLRSSRRRLASGLQRPVA
jgi:hypothetical protein